MAQNGTLIINGEGEQAVFQYNHTTDGSGLHKNTLHTKNTFVDKDIEINVTTPEAGAMSLDVTDSSAALNMGTANEGYYYPKATISGNASVATAGWVDEDPIAVSESNVQVGKVAQSTLKNGSTTIASGDQVIPLPTDDQTINISEGYNTARTVVVKAMEDGQAATVSSSNATISSLTFTADDGNGAFNISGTQAIAAPTVSQNGYISSTVGTKNPGTATVSTTVDQVTVGVTVTGTTKVKPEITRTAKPGDDTWVDAASGSATTTKPNSGAYVRVDAAAKTNNISSVGKVTAAGYGTTTSYQSDAATTTEIGSNAADATYIPIGVGSVASSTAEISTVAISYDSTGGNFKATGSANIPAPTVAAAGYVGNGLGTLSGATGGATVEAGIAKIGIAANLTGTGTKKPVIAKSNATNVVSDAATTTQPSDGYYVAVNSPANTGTVQATAEVTSAGYGTTTSGQYNTTSSSPLTVGAEASDTTYIPISAATFANTETSGQTYEDISSTAPALIEGDYLYINKGYTSNKKISLAKLVPDHASAGLAAAHILQGYSAYNNDGTLINGTIPTYDGSYTVA